MNTFNTLPAGVRLDVWLEATSPLPAQDTPEVAQLRDELRRSMPEFVRVLEILAKMRPIRDLAGRLAAPQPVQLTIQKR